MKIALIYNRKNDEKTREAKKLAREAELYF